MVFETVAQMIAKQLKMDVKDITPDKRLVEDLKADSAITTLKTVGDVARYIESKQG